MAKWSKTIIEKVSCDMCSNILWKHGDAGIEPEGFTLHHREVGAQGMESAYSEVHLCAVCQDAVFDHIKSRPFKGAAQ